MTTPPEPAPAPTPTPPTPAPAPQAQPPTAPGLAAPAAPPVPQPAPAAPTPIPTPPPVPTPPTWTPPAPAPPDDGMDGIDKLPQKWQKTITDLRGEAAKYRTSARSETVLRHAYATAGQHGVNGDALLGSVAFTAAAEQLDPNSPQFPPQLAAAITATLQANPWMAAQPAAPPPAAPAAPAPPPRGSGDFPGGTGAGQPISEEQLAQMSPEQVAKALADGKLRHLM